MDKKNNTGNCNTGNYNTGDWNTGYFNTGDWNTGYWNTGYCNTGNRNTGSRNTGFWNTGNCNTGNRNTGDCNTGNFNTGDCNTGFWNTGDCNTGNRNTGSRNTGFWNTGDWNTGNYNTGFCNTITPEDILIFNKPAKRSDWIDAVKPDWMYVALTQWVYEEDMTDKEKEAYPSYTTTGGYLKVYTSLQHAYIEAWEQASEEDRELTYKLPNFDPVVFEEIFGFNPCKDKEITETKAEIKTIDIDGVTYRLERI